MDVAVIADPEGSFARALSKEAPPSITLSIARELPEDSTAEVLICGRPKEEWLTAATNLRWVVIPFAGLPRLTVERLEPYPQIGLLNLHHNAAPTAEHAIGLLIAVAKQIVPADRALRTGDWRMRYAMETSQILAGRRALVLGGGAIGTRIARVLRAMDLSVKVLVRQRRDDREEIAVADQIEPGEIDATLPETDVVICALPDTPETRGSFDATRLARLPAHTLIVNVGRAAIFDDEALFRALEEGRLGGAGLDVWPKVPETEEERENTEPSPFPYHSLENVVLSPHRAGHGAGIESLRASHCLDRLDEISRGVASPIDRTRGY